jgi:hypothetical protein
MREAAIAQSLIETAEGVARQDGSAKVSKIKLLTRSPCPLEKTCAGRARF